MNSIRILMNRLSRLVRRVIELPILLFMTVAWFWFYICDLVAFLWFVSIDFLVNWLQTRPVRPILFGLPPALLAGGVVAVAFQARSDRLENVTREYAAAVAEESRLENWQAADLYLAKLAFLDMSNPDTQFSLAVAAERHGELSRARELMRNIAPADRRGHPRAHFWLARDLAKQNEYLDDSAQQLVEHHLVNTVDRLPGGDSQAHLLLGQLYLKQGKLESAVDQLQAASEAQPKALLVLMRLYARTARRRLAEKTAAKAIECFQRLVEEEPQNVTHRLNWAQSELFLKKHDEAARILLSGLAGGKLDERTLDGTAEAPRKNGDRRATEVGGESVAEHKDRSDAGEGSALQVCRSELANVYVSWFDHTRAKDGENVALQLELLEKALRAAPDHPGALNRLAVFAVWEHEKSAEAVKVVKQILARGGAPATVHFILGTGGLIHNYSEQGMQHLEIAFEQMPQIPAVANNLAWGLAHADPPRLARAEKIVDAAIKLAPTHPEIRATRGVIYEKLGKYQEAIVEFEHALQAFPNRASIHARLAKLYERLGDTELAAEHQRIAFEGK